MTLLDPLAARLSFIPSPQQQAPRALRRQHPSRRQPLRLPVVPLVASRAENKLPRVLNDTVGLFVVF